MTKKYIDKATQYLNKPITELKKLFLVVTLSTALSTIAAHAYSFFNLNLNHDYMNEYYTLDATGWKIAIGRFLMPPTQALLGLVSVIPWVSGMIMIASLTVASILIIKMFNLTKRWQVIFLPALLVTNTFFIALIASFMEELATDSIAILLATASAFYWSRVDSGHRAKNIFLSSVTLFLSLGLYQGFLPLTLSLIAISSIKDLLDKQNVQKIAKKISTAIAYVAVSCIAYYISTKIVSMITNYPLATNTTNSISNIWKNPSEIPARLIEAYVYTLWGIFAPSFASAPRKANLSWPSLGNIQPFILSLINIAILLVSLAIIIRLIKNNRQQPDYRIRISMIIFIIITLPLIANIMHVLSGTSHTLMHYAFMSFYILFFALMSLLKNKNGRSITIVTSCLLLTLIYQNTVLANNLYAQKDLESKATLSTMTRILDDIESVEDYDIEKTKICIIGTYSLQSGTKDSEEISKVFGADYNSSITYQASFEAYLHTALQYNAKLCNAQETREIIETEAYKNMSVYPKSGSISVIDDIVVVKTSEEPRF